MEQNVDRIKDIQRREYDEKQKLSKRLVDRKVITDQIQGYNNYSKYLMYGLTLSLRFVSMQKLLVMRFIIVIPPVRIAFHIGVIMDFPCVSIVHNVCA